MKYGVDKSHIAHQTINGEAIVIDFVLGIYFSMRDSAAEIWQLLARSMPVDDLIGLYRADNPEQAEAVESEIRTFIAEVAAANLLSRDVRFFEANPPDTPIERGPFATPLLEKFDDMSELLLLDPVHDVTEHGWPHKSG